MSNTFHRYLNIQIMHDIDLFTKTSYDPTTINHITLNKEDLNPKFFELLESLDITVNWFEAFYTPPNGGKLPIHTDGDQENYVKINYTYGAAGSTMRWWTPKSTEYINTVETAFGQRYFSVDEPYADLVYEVEIINPSLVNAGLFHSTYNPTDQGRWTLSLPLSDKITQGRISWDEAIKRLEGYIK